MILRRVSDAFRKQDWFTVTVETLIVVLGVFLGLQVNNWNAARQAAGNEAALLIQMHEGFTDDVRSVIDGREPTEESIEAIRYILRAIRDGEAPEDRDAFLTALKKSRMVPTNWFEAPISAVLISSGGLTDISSPELRQAVVNYHSLIGVLQRRGAALDALLENIENGAESGVYLNPDMSSGDNLIYDYDFDAVAAKREFYQRLLLYALQTQSMSDQLIAVTETILEEIEAAQK